MAGLAGLGDLVLTCTGDLSRNRQVGLLANDASALLIYRAAWQQDVGGTDNRRAAAMAKLHATEAAQQVIDGAVQLHGGAGVTRGFKVEELYRDIRALRIYEGASDIQRLVIAGTLLP